MDKTTKKGKPINYVVGFTTSHGLLLDLDGIPLTKVKALAKYYCARFKLQGYLIARSSQNNYHVIFNRYLSWPTTLEYLFKVVWNFHYHNHGSMPHLTNWAILQAIKHSQTLRIGSKDNKKPPKTVFIQGKTQSLIRDYLHFRSEAEHEHNSTISKTA